MIDFSLGGLATWVPPLTKTYRRLLDFDEDYATNEKVRVAFDEYEKYKSSTVGKHPNFIFTDCGTDLRKAIAAAPNWTFGGEISNIKKTLIQNDLLRRISITDGQNGTKRGAVISVSSATSKPAITDEPKTRSPDYLKGKHEDEISLQHHFPEVFVLKSARTAINLSESELQSICNAWDILQLSLIDVTQRIKQFAHFDRPTPPYSVTVPAHSTWPGGHAVASGALVALIYFVFHLKRSAKPDVDLLYKMAYRIAWNRERAGLHWTEDTTDGLNIGASLMGELFKSLDKDVNQDFSSLLK